ncbi:MAG: response regulator [Methylobacillus sp.]|jgi:serine/threonine-protein kinase|nr:response regulator [Methylobacillus sp.]
MQEKARLLFVDDEERIVNLLRTIFRATYEVHTATSGQEALQLAATQNFDVIVSDQRMPGMTGIDLLAEMRRRHPATMRILLTGYSDLTAIVGSVNEGEVFRFINKPWNHEEIKQIIAEAANAARATATLVTTPTAEVDPLVAPISQADQAGVLVIDDAPDDRQMVTSALSEHFTVYSAANIPEALRVLENKNIGVIVAEAQIGGQGITDLLRVLKQHHPAVTAVMLTNMADSNFIVKLINGAQIFRFSIKPVRSSTFRLTVKTAMKEHYRMLANPALTQRYSVDTTTELENPSLATGILSSLRERFRRFAGFAG